MNRRKRKRFSFGIAETRAPAFATAAGNQQSGLTRYRDRRITHTLALCTSVLVLGAGAVAGQQKSDKSREKQSVYSFTVKDIDGKDVSLSEYKGKVCLIVNVASQ